MDGLNPPRLLDGNDILAGFDCGVPALNDWLKRRALAIHLTGAARSYVMDYEGRVIAFYCLAAGSVDHQTAPGNIRRNMPSPVPVVVLGRLAIDLKFQGKGLGKVLVLDAIDRTIALAGQVGIRAILVHAKDAAAAEFYRSLGFVASPHNAMLLMARV